jgi:hypothetical protein
VFGMGTGDPSQYGHRQIVRGSKSIAVAVEIGSKLSPRSRLNLDGAWRVGLPAADRDIWFVPDGYARAEQERGGNLAPQEE